MPAYYNENDPKAAAWLRELIKAGHIAPGDVDERSIEDVTPMDVAGYTQCHFFAGIGGWSYALRLAGWSDTRNVWTGSCPCQPFSAAGKGGGFSDERHLWPAWHHLIEECRPPVIFGEQVASPAGLGWFDVVHADLEDADYAVGAADLCAAGVGAPHIRQRLYFVADSNGRKPSAQRQQRSRQHGLIAQDCGPVIGLADDDDERRHRSGAFGQSGRSESTDGCELGNTSGTGSGRDAGTVLGKKEIEWALRCLANEPESAGDASRLQHAASDGRIERGSEPGQWSTVGGCEFIPCTDGKARPVEPGTFPLVNGLPGRVGLLRGYGNAIVPQVAAAFIAAYEVSGDPK